MKIQIINGPNLNLLGIREPGIYGNSSFDTYLQQLRDLYPDIQINYYQSNVEGELINVYLLNGQLVRSFSSTGSKAHIALPSNAVYIIKIGTKTIKIPMIKK